MSAPQNNLYNINGISTSPPPGSIMGYLGTQDPSGWVIADGIQRSYTGTNIYSNLISMGIGTSGTGTYTPPNYQGAFLRGTGTSDITYSYQYGTSNNATENATAYYIGPSLQSYQSDNAYVGYSLTDTSAPNTANSNAPGPSTGGVFYRSSGYGYSNGTYNGFGLNTFPDSNSSNYNYTVNLVTNAGIYENRSFNYGVNWIVKL